MRIRLICALAAAAMSGACTTTDPAGGPTANFVAAPGGKSEVSRAAIEEQLLRSVALSL
jgi:hypothetical protein